MSHTILMSVMAALGVWASVVMLHALLSARNPATDALAAEEPAQHHDHDDDHGQDHVQAGGGRENAHH